MVRVCVAYMMLSNRSLFEVQWQSWILTFVACFQQIIIVCPHTLFNRNESSNPLGPCVPTNVHGHVYSITEENSDAQIFKIEYPSNLDSFHLNKAHTTILHTAKSVLKNN